jgi:hypothetical protein
MKYIHKWDAVLKVISIFEAVQNSVNGISVIRHGFPTVRHNH